MSSVKNPVPSRVLVIDDSDFDRDLFSSVLIKKGFEVRGLNSAIDCSEQIEQFKPDVVIMDILMPQVQGNEALKIIREKFNSVELPIIMITSKSEPADIIESLRWGANDYITKPINFDVAVMRILTQLQISSLTREMSRLKELEAVSAMITTYNHEINNPLSVAIGNLRIYTEKADRAALERLEGALWKIAEIVKKIDQVTQGENLDYDRYSPSSKIIKLK